MNGPRSPSVAVAEMAPLAWALASVVADVEEQFAFVQLTVVLRAWTERRGMVPSGLVARSIECRWSCSGSGVEVRQVAQGGCGLDGTGPGGIGQGGRRGGAGHQVHVMTDDAVAKADTGMDRAGWL